MCTGSRSPPCVHLDRRLESDVVVEREDRTRTTRVPEAPKVRARGAGRVDVDGPGGPGIEEPRLAPRRLDDHSIERSWVLPVREEQRAVMEHDRPARHDDRDGRVLEDGGRAPAAL